MRIPLLLFLLAVAGTSLNAQLSFSFTPDTLLEAEANPEIYNIYQLDILNETENPLTLSWRRLQNDYPEGWEVSFCDNNVCYGLIPINGDMIPFGPDETAFLKLDIHPHEIAGTGIFRFLVFPSGEQNNYQLASFIINSGVTSNTVEAQLLKLSVFPNPTNDYLQIKNNNGSRINIAITDATGTHILTQALQAQSEQQISLRHLPSGAYYLTGYAEGQAVFQHKIIKL